MYSVIIYGFFSFLTGILLNQADEGMVLLFFIAAVIIILIRLIFTGSINSRLLICIILLCLGNMKYNSFMTKDNVIDDFNNEYAYVTAKICDIPMQYEDTFQYIVVTDNFMFQNMSIKHRTTIKVTSNIKYGFGDTVRFYGTVKEYLQNPNSTAFDSKEYYNTRHIFYKMYSEYSEYADYNISDKSISYIINNIRNRLYNKIISTESDKKYSDMITRIFLHYSSDMDEELKNIFLRAATWRFLYSARIHFLIIMSIFAMISHFVGRKKRDILLMIIMVLYVFVNPDGASGLRIMIYMCVMVIFKRLRGFYNFNDTLCLALLVIGLINPIMLTNSGLIISAASCFGIHLFYTPIFKFFKKYINIRISQLLTIYIIFMCIMSPLVLFMGFEMSPYFIILTPVFFTLIYTCFIIAPFYYIIGGIFIWLMHLICLAMIYISVAVEKLPGCTVYIVKPTVLFLIVWYIGVLALKYKNMRKYLVCCFAGFLSVLLYSQAARLNDIEVHYVSVGQGDGAAVVLPYRANILIDGGGNNSLSDYDHGRYEYVPYLKTNGITDIDAAFVSHYHEDHALGIIAALENFRIDVLYLPYVIPDNEIYKQLTDAAVKNGTEVVYVLDGDVITFRDGLTVDIKLVNNQPNEDMNECSMVCKFKYGEFSALFSGDIGEQTERALIASEYDMSCSILKVPHHGSAGSSSVEFLRETAPDCAFAGIGFNNTFGFPKESALKRYKDLGIPFFSTATSGNIVVKSEKNSKIEIYRN